MNLKVMTKYGLLIITVILGLIIKDLIAGFIKDFYLNESYLAIFIDMMVAVFVFIPLFGIVSTYIAKFSKVYLEQSKSLGKTRKRGFIIGFMVAFIILFFLYAYVKFDVNILEDIGIM